MIILIITSSASALIMDLHST